MRGDLIEFVAMLITMTTASIVVLRLSFAAARRLEAKPKTEAIPSDVAARLERIEHAVDSVAIEVERISEGQRFTTKVLSDRSSRPPEPK